MHLPSLIAIFLWSLTASASEPLMVGISADYPPFESYEHGEIIGFDIDLVKLLAKKIGREIIIKDMDFNGLIPALNSGKVDMVLSGMDPTPERRQAVDFTNVYYQSSVVALVSNQELVKTFDLRGKRIGAQLGSRYEGIAVNWQHKYPDIKVEARARVPQLVEELRQNYIDILLVSDAVAQLILQHNQGFYPIPQPSEDKETAAIAVKKGSALLPQLNQALKGMHDDGSLSALTVKWMAAGSIEEVTKTQRFMHYSKYITFGIFTTLQYTIIALALGFVLAIPLVIAKQSDLALLRAAAQFYTSVFRGTPLLVQLSIMYYGLPSLLGFNLPPYAAAVITFSLNSAAYVSEILQAGINSIDAGQSEAARALGLSKWQTLKLILFPQAFRNQGPALLNEMIDLLKESSLVSIIGEADIMRRAQLVSVQTYDFMTPLLIAALCYYVLVLLLGQAVAWLQKRAGQS